MLVVGAGPMRDGVSGPKRRRMPTSLSCGSSWMTQRRYCGLSEHWWWTGSDLWSCFYETVSDIVPPHGARPVDPDSLYSRAPLRVDEATAISVAHAEHLISPRRQRGGGS